MAGYGIPVSRRALLRNAKKWPRIRPDVPQGPHPLPVQLAHVAQWFHAASDTTRLAILECLAQRERSVTEIQQMLDAPQSNVSFHLKVLRESGLVREHREGRWKYFGLEGQTLQYMIEFTHKVGPEAHRGTCPLVCCRP